VGKAEAICAMESANIPEMMQPVIQPMPAPAPPTEEIACANELMPPERMQMIENEIAKFENFDMERDSSCA
jgi:hypothetical protein